MQEDPHFQLNRLFKQLYYHRLEFHLSPHAEINLDSWIGSVLRNNLLYAANHIMVDEHTSLYSLINQIPIHETHSFYKQLSGGFPKGFSITGIKQDSDDYFPYVLHKRKPFIFSICLVDRFAGYYPFFIEAVRYMCKRGFGNPVKPLELTAVYEIHPFNRPVLLSFEENGSYNSLKSPVYVTDFLENIPESSLKSKDIRVLLQTPVNLVRNRQKTNRDSSYQDKLQGFPGLYQLTRSVMFRLLKLIALYTEIDETYFTEEISDKLEEYLQEVPLPVLTCANIRRIMMKSTPRKEIRDRIKFWGYIGEMEYYGKFDRFLPYLLFSQDLGVGNDVVYGLGQYRIQDLK